MQDRDAADLALLIDAARAAGDIALHHAKGDPKRWEKPDGAGPVTEADLAVDAMLRDRLSAARPDYGWLSEESPDDTDRLTRQRLFIIDPIDGTRAYIEGSGNWSHSLAVAEDGVVTAAVVFLPVKDRMYAAALGHGATLNGDAIACSDQAGLDGATLLATRPTYDSRNWRGAVPSLLRKYRPSLAYRLSLVAEGRYDAMLTLRKSWEWDIAAGALIIAEAGARITDRAGQPLRFNSADPRLDGVLAAGPSLHAALLAELQPAG